MNLHENKAFMNYKFFITFEINLVRSSHNTTVRHILTYLNRTSDMVLLKNKLMFGSRGNKLDKWKLLLIKMKLWKKLCKELRISEIVLRTKENPIF